jgi:hypothetical protein
MEYAVGSRADAPAGGGVSLALAIPRWGTPFHRIYIHLPSPPTLARDPTAVASGGVRADGAVGGMAEVSPGLGPLFAIHRQVSPAMILSIFRPNTGKL